MKKKFGKACRKYLNLLVLSLIIIGTDAQIVHTKFSEQAMKPPKPFMWSPYNQRLIDSFTKFKFPHINNYYRKVVQPSSFVMGNFLGMIDYFNRHYRTDFECLHVYIAAYSRNNSSKVPHGYGRQLVLIFAPAKKYSSGGETDLDYFAIPPEGSFDEGQVENFKVNSVQRAWRSNYVNKIMKSILKSINKDDADNMIDGSLSDTRCITYCSKDLMELVYEQKSVSHINASDTKVDLSDSMKATFAAFGPNGNYRRMNAGRFRLFIIFDFLDTNGNVFHLEDSKGFTDRDDPLPTCENCQGPNANKNVLSTDNGTLCPPCTNCPPGTSGCTPPLHKP